MKNKFNRIFKNKKITVLSTFAKDKIIDKQGRIIRTQKGGPAFYILNIFKKENVFFNVIVAPAMQTEIILSKNGEVGRAVTKLKRRKMNFPNIKSQFLLISTILDEFSLNGLSKFGGKVFLDIQGYVRDGRKLGGKQKWVPSEKIISSIFCLKGTGEEIKYLPSNFVKCQKQKILIVTKGKIGCSIFSFGKKYKVKNRRNVNVHDTIGAGDTFFAYFISKFLKTDNVLASGKYAVTKTSNFLSEKKK